MEYLSVKEAAALWGISERYVQHCCTQGRIAGVSKHGKSWVIPANAEKPADLRRGRALLVLEGSEAKEKFKIPMPLLNASFKPGHCMEDIVQMEDADSRNIALAEYYYFSGQAKKATNMAEGYLASENIALRLSACWIYGYANLALDCIPHARRALTQIQDTLAAINEASGPQDAAIAVCVATGASTLLHLPLPKDLPSLRPILPLLPPGLRLFALYVQAHGAYLHQQYAASIGIVETALAVEGEKYPIPAIYLHLVATMDYMSLKQPQQAREHILAAWEIARHDGLIQPFGEHHGLLGGMLEAAIRKDWPEDFQRMIAITYSFSAGWRKIHNPDTGHDVADDLSTTEFVVAMLAARNWTNKEIGVHLGLSPNTVKSHLSCAFQKLGITQRREMRQFMLK